VPDARITAPDGADRGGRRDRRLRRHEIRVRGTREIVARLPQGARGLAARTAALVQGAPALAAAAVRVGQRLRRFAASRRNSASSRASRRELYGACIARCSRAFARWSALRGEEGVYLGTRGVKFHIFPGSPLKRRKPPGSWRRTSSKPRASMARASRRSSRPGSNQRPQLLKREYLEPDWSEAREEVVARERTSFLGLILHADRTVNYGPIAPEESRQIFAREALVYQRLSRRPDWLLANDAALAAAQARRGAPAHARSGHRRGIARRFLRQRAAAAGLERRDAGTFHAGI
jgi:HrpA-like RNA helicase